MTRPLFGSNLAPQEEHGRLYDVVHACTGERETRDWAHGAASRIATLNNDMQADPDAACCPAGDDCFGWLVFAGRRAPP